MRSETLNENIKLQDRPPSYLFLVIILNGTTKARIVLCVNTSAVISAANTAVMELFMSNYDILAALLLTSVNITQSKHTKLHKPFYKPFNTVTPRPPNAMQQIPTCSS